MLLPVLVRVPGSDTYVHERNPHILIFRQIVNLLNDHRPGMTSGDPLFYCELHSSSILLPLDTGTNI